MAEYICYYSYLVDLLAVTHVVYAVYEGVVAAVAHSQPVTTEPDHVDVSVSGKRNLYCKYLLTTEHKVVGYTASCVRYC